MNQFAGAARKLESPKPLNRGSICCVIWVFIFGGVALLGLGALIGYVVSLSHKLEALGSELQMVRQRGKEAGELWAAVQLSTTKTTKLS